jgi:hypothetical protein
VSDQFHSPAVLPLEGGQPVPTALKAACAEEPIRIWKSSDPVGKRPPAVQSVASNKFN